MTDEMTDNPQADSVEARYGITDLKAREARALAMGGRSVWRVSGNADG